MKDFFGSLFCWYNKHMSSNINIFMDTAFILTILFVIPRIIYLRSNRQKILNKYAKKPSLQKQYENIMSTKRLIIVLVLAILITLKTAIDINYIIQNPEDVLISDIYFSVILASIMCFIVLLLILYLNKILEPSINK